MFIRYNTFMCKYFYVLVLSQCRDADIAALDTSIFKFNQPDVQAVCECIVVSRVDKRYVLYCVICRYGGHAAGSGYLVLTRPIFSWV